MRDFLRLPLVAQDELLVPHHKNQQGIPNRRMRDSNPQGQSPAVFKTADLPISLILHYWQKELGIAVFITKKNRFRASVSQAIRPFVFQEIWGLVKSQVTYVLHGTSPRLSSLLSSLVFTCWQRSKLLKLTHPSAWPFVAGKAKITYS